jgi:hypothetical protein
MTYPVFIVCRDRLTCLLGLLGWLESVDNADEVYLIDNASTWEPLLDYYETTPHTVIRRKNEGHRVGWTSGILRQYAAGRPFIYTDPDVLPVEDCPADALERMAAVLHQTPGLAKCGFSIKIDDLAPWIADRSVAWESRYWENWDEHRQAYRAPIDTTFALYAPYMTRRFRYNAYRLPPPYSIRHLPWHMTLADMDTPEERYYVEHADPTISNFTRDVLGAIA